MNIPKISALYESSLASALSEAGTSFSVVSGTDRDGNALSGLYGFIIDEGSADEEFVIGTISGTTVTITYRGIDADAPNTEVSANKKAHGRGASVKITDYPILGVLRNILNGEETLPNKISYASHPTFNADTQIIDKKYADDLAIAGAPDASETVKGLGEIADIGEIDGGSGDGTGDTTAPLLVTAQRLGQSIYYSRLPSSSQKSALASTTTPGSGNKYVSQKDFQIGAELYAASSSGTDTYAITLSPAPASYVTGMVVRFKADVANTGTASLNVNSLGALTLKKYAGGAKVALDTGDIIANQFVVCIYDGTDLVIISPLAAHDGTFKNGTATKAENDASTTQNIAHGLGRIPKKVRIKATYTNAAGSQDVWAETVYNGTTQSSQNKSDTGTGSYAIGTTFMISSVGTSGSNNNTGVVTFDATNIIITWTKTGTPGSVTWQLLWEAEA